MHARILPMNKPRTAPPKPPQKPAPEDCCQSDCCPCVFEIYENELADYENALALWQKLNGVERNPQDKSESNLPLSK